MNLVLLFFVQSVVASLLLGLKFVSKRGMVFKNFGIALLLDAAAFLIWSFAVITKPVHVEQYVSFGTIFFIISLVFMLAAGTQELSKKMQRTVMVLGVVVGATIFYLGGTPAFPSTPGFSPEGFFFFNVHPLLQALYVFAFVLVAFPAIEAVASKFKGGMTEWLVRYGFAAQVAGGVVLITSLSSTVGNTPALNFTGWAMGIVYLVLFLVLVLYKKAWSNVD